MHHEDALFQRRYHIQPRIFFTQSARQHPCKCSQENPCTLCIHSFNDSLRHNRFTRSSQQALKRQRRESATEYVVLRNHLPISHLETRGLSAPAADVRELRRCPCDAFWFISQSLRHCVVIAHKRAVNIHVNYVCVGSDLNKLPNSITDRIASAFLQNAGFFFGQRAKYLYCTGTMRTSLCHKSSISTNVSLTRSHWPQKASLNRETHIVATIVSPLQTYILVNLCRLCSSSLANAAGN